MKAKDLARLLDGVNPDANVYIDLGICYNKTKKLIYRMLTDYDYDMSDVQCIELGNCINGVKDVYLCPYDGQYDELADDKEVESFFEEHGLNEVMEKAFEEA
jgi:hypothetical protein